MNKLLLYGANIKSVVVIKPLCTSLAVACNDLPINLTSKQKHRIAFNFFRALTIGSMHKQDEHGRCAGER